MSKHPNILVDLRVVIDKGFCGIGQDSATTFRYLSNQNVDVAGLLFSSNAATLWSHFKKSLPATKAIEQTTLFFHELFEHQPLFIRKKLLRLKVKKLLALLRRHFDLIAIDPLFAEVIWRNGLGKYIEPQYREEILSRNFYYTNMTMHNLMLTSYLRRGVSLDTTGFDFALFPNVRSVSVSKNTKKLVRYHDAIPITEPDFTPTSSSLEHMVSLNHCAKDSYFICNSDPTREMLLKLHPEVEQKSFVIPCTISHPYKKVQDEAMLKKILSMRLSSHLADHEQLQKIRDNIANNPAFDYVLNIATFDPKKNLISLIRAWEKLNLTNQRQIKLVVLANPGWFSEEIENCMRMHIAQGNLIHLQGVAGNEMEYLYSHAKVFVFPSYSEGFGIPALEAIHCECPVIASDIPALRWALGDAGLFCDPYYPDTLLDALQKLLYAADANDLRARLIQKGVEKTKFYAHDRLAGLWVEMLNKI